MKQTDPTQSPSKVVIVPKPPKNSVDTPPVPEVKKEDLEKDKLEQVKESADTVKAEKPLPSK